MFLHKSYHLKSHASYPEFFFQFFHLLLIERKKIIKANTGIIVNKKVPEKHKLVYEALKFF